MSGANQSCHRSIERLEGEWRNAISRGDHSYLELLRHEYGRFATPSAQRDVYGIERWNAEFIRLGDLSDQKLAAALWEALPYSRFKQMQEAFCSPEDRCVPRDYQKLGTKIVYSPTANLSLRAILINPDLVPEDLLKNLGLADFSDVAGKKDGRLLERCRPETILGLKLALASAQSLEAKNHRVLLLRSATELGEFPPESRRISEDAEGMLLITRTVEGARSGRRLMVQFYNDPHSAIRSELQIGAGYEDERRSINNDLAEINFIRTRMDKQWSSIGAEGRNKLKLEVEQVLIRTIEKIEGAQNDHKEAAVRLLELARTIQDKTGKLNPTVALSRITAALSRFRQRREETHSIQKHIDADKVSLLDEMDYCRACLKRYRRAIEDAAEVVGKSKITESEGIRTAGRAKNADQIMSQITLDPKYILPFRFAPYITFAKVLGAQRMSLEEALRAGDRDEAQKSLVRMQIVAKLHAAYEVFEETKIKALQAEADDGGRSKRCLEDVLGWFGKLSSFFNDRQILKEVEVEPHLSAIFEGHREKLQEIIEGLTHAVAPGQEVEPRKLLKDIDSYLRDTFNISSIVKLFMPLKVPTPKPGE